ncbi:unnamed protein product [Owenia fusiformis]|uniref:Uncharacterized protein n=1 Tax=Owenia fusiformis TaxID=6347 RepID=A0A8S4NRH8_OWEFU|nr:unnamed protein product [Owenia fusiformis]
MGDDKLKYVLLISYVSAVMCHSWLTCTDYLEENGEYWNKNICRAWPRHAHRFAHRDGQHGSDTGFDVNNPPSHAPCRTSRDDSSYDSLHPMAVYFPGQRIVITHPTKNHVVDVRCTNKYIPDNGNFIYVGPRNGNDDPSLSVFKQNLVVDLGVSPFGHHISNQMTMTYPKPGFQNAPKFCENPDKALGTYAFNLPSDFQPGRYTFLWAWYFNGKNDLYTGCWEADVVASRADRDHILRQRKQSTSDPVNIAGDNRVPVAPTQPVPPTEQINGGWGSWSSYTHCSKPCGGQQTRTRNCDNPVPQNGGRFCKGNNQNQRACNTHSCTSGNNDNNDRFDDLKATYTAKWNSGFNGRILIPAKKPSRPWVIVLEFPCVPDSFNTWHANDVTPQSDRSKGKFTLKQSGWQLEKPDIGFSVNYPWNNRCKNKSANDIKVSVVYS